MDHTSLGKDNLYVLNFATRLLLTNADRRGLTHTALETLSDFSQSERLTLLTYDKDNHLFHIEGVWSGTSAFYPNVHFHADEPEYAALLSRKTTGIFGLQFVEGAPMPTENDTGAPARALLLPVVAVHGKLIGQIVIDLGARKEIDPERMQHLRILSTVIAMALENVAMIEHAIIGEEARYRAIVEYSPDMVVRMTAATKIVFVNDTFARLLRVSRADVIGQPFRLDVAESDREIFDTMSTALTPDMAPRTYSFRIILPDETIRWNEWTVSAITDELGHFMEYQAIGRDTTLQRLAEDDRREMEAKMVDAQKMESLGVLAGGIAHDFNNLLATILGNTELSIETPGVPQEVVEYLQEAKNAITKASKLSHEMLLYAGQHPTQLRPLNLNHALEQIHHLFEANLSKNTGIIYNLAKELPDISADTAQIQQVLINMVINANESLNEQPGTITITSGTTFLKQRVLARIIASPALKEGDYVYIQVADTGCGIKRDEVRQIFEPFFTTKFIGRGLGLAAVRGIVRAHKGAIRVVSRPGEGSVFTLYFPMHGTHSTEIENATPTAKRAATGPGRILVVDDEESVRRIVQYVLGKSGYSVTCASDGKEALDIFMTAPDKYDAVLLDLKMPKVSGEEVFRVLQETHPDVPVIVLTGYTEESMLEYLQQKRPAGFIQKPFEVKALLELLHRIV